MRKTILSYCLLMLTSWKFQALWFCASLPIFDAFQPVQPYSRRQPQPPRVAPLYSTSTTVTVAPVLKDLAPTWATLKEKLQSTPTGSRLSKELAERERGRGPPHSDARLRLFPEENGEISEADARVTLYRDHSAWCPYCQRVWLYLEQRKIPYRVRKVPLNAYGDKPAWYTRKVDGGNLPAIEIDDILTVDSGTIVRVLEEAFPDHHPKMIPSGVANETRTKQLKSLEDKLQQDWFSLVFYPVTGDALKKANETLVTTLAQVDHELSTTPGPWFLGGGEPSMVDLNFITSFGRLIASCLYWKGLAVRNTLFPHIDKWLNAFESLQSYMATKSDFYTHAMVIPSQNGPGYLIPEAKPIACQISGLLAGAWSLPLNLSESFEFCSSCNIGTDAVYNPADEAAYHLTMNHANITRFACRGAGEVGRPSFHAELADPYAEPDDDYREAVDVCLRHVTHALLEGADCDNVVSPAMEDLLGVQGNDEFRENWEAFEDEDIPSLTYYWNYESGDVSWTPPTKQLDTCLAYLRDRVGVPRDMPGEAAMYFRAHLNWVIGVMRA